MTLSLYQDDINDKAYFNYQSALMGLQNTLEELLSTQDKMIHSEYIKIDLNPGNKEDHSVLSESLSIIKKTINRKKSISESTNLENDLSKLTGKQWSTAVKYAKVSNRKILKQLRTFSEYRDVLKYTFDSIMKNLTNELRSIDLKFDQLTVEKAFSNRKSIETDIPIRKTFTSRMSSVGSGMRKSTDITSILSPLKSDNQTIYNPTKGPTLTSQNDQTQENSNDIEKLKTLKSSMRIESFISSKFK